MEKDEVLKMARQAGFMLVTDSQEGQSDWYECFTEEIEAFAKLVAMRTLEGTYDEMIDIVRKQEREACAKFFDDNETLMFWGSQAATHIRARGEQHEQQ